MIDTTQIDARYEAARSHRAPEGRVPGFFLFAWSPLRSGSIPVNLKEDPHHGAREAVDRLCGAMGHAGMKTLAEQVLPAGSARYVADLYDGTYLDGGLYVPYDPKAVAQLCFLFRGCFLHLKFPAEVVNGPYYDEKALDRWLDRYFRGQTADAEGDTAELEMLHLREDVWDFPEEARDRFAKYVNALFIRHGFRHPSEERRRMEDAVAEFADLVAPDFDKCPAPDNQVDVVRFARRYLKVVCHQEPGADEASLVRKAAAFTTARLEGMVRYRLTQELGLATHPLPGAPAKSIHEAVAVMINDWLVSRLSE